MNDTAVNENTSELDEKDSTKFDDLLAEARRVWRRAGVRRHDRQAMLAELQDELTGASLDGFSAATVLGEDRPETLRQWAQERGLSGRALRLHLVLPAALIGIAAGLAVVLSFIFLAFLNRTSFEPGSFIVPLYGSAGLLAYLCGLALAGGALAAAGDPHAKSTVRWLAVLLPVGAAVSTGAGVAVAWLMGFNTSPPVFVTVVAVVLACLVLTIGIARYATINEAVDRPEEID